MTPTTPDVTFVFRITAEIGTVRSGGVGAYGERLHIPITGGRVEGPDFRGRILSGGSDWPIIRRDGVSLIEARYTVEVEDGTLLLIHNRGLRVSSEQVLAKLRAKEPVSPDDYYFRTVAEIDAPDGPHQWLREAIFVGSAVPGEGAVVIDIFRVG